MGIPDTAEQLIENAGEHTLYAMFPEFSKLPIRHQKLLRLLNNELITGQLTDATFVDSLCFLTSVWLNFNTDAQNVNRERIVFEPEIDTEWVEAAEHYAAMHTYLLGVLSAIRLIPGGLERNRTHPARYCLPRTHDH